VCNDPRRSSSLVRSPDDRPAVYGPFFTLNRDRLRAFPCIESGRALCIVDATITDLESLIRNFGQRDVLLIRCGLDSYNI